MLLYSVLHLVGLRPAARRAQALPPVGLADARATPSATACTSRRASRSPPARSARASPTASAWRWPSASCASASAREVQDHHIYAIVSDGDLMEGIASEAASLAGHLGLGRLVYLYDDNDVSLDGPTALSFDAEDVGKRFEAYGWHVLEVARRQRPRRARGARSTTRMREDERPSLIRVKSIIGYPVAQQAGHERGARRAARRGRGARDEGGARAGTPTRTSSCPTASTSTSTSRRAAPRCRPSGTQRFAPGARSDAELRRGVGRRLGGPAAAGRRRGAARRSTGARTSSPRASPGRRRWRRSRPSCRRWSAAPPTSRESTKTEFPGGDDERFTRERRRAQRLLRRARARHGRRGQRHGRPRRHRAPLRLDVPAVRRLHARLDPPVGADRPAVAWVFTHDSVALGEDGPTHQPVEHLAALRAIPGLTVLRPADARRDRRGLARDPRGPRRARPCSRSRARTCRCSTRRRDWRRRRRAGAYVAARRRRRAGGASSAPAPSCPRRARGRRPARRRRRRRARRLDAELGAVRRPGRGLPRRRCCPPALPSVSRRGRRLDGLGALGRPARSRSTASAPRRRARRCSRSSASRHRRRPTRSASCSPRCRPPSRAAVPRRAPPSRGSRPARAPRRSGSGR